MVTMADVKGDSLVQDLSFPCCESILAIATNNGGTSDVVLRSIHGGFAYLCVAKGTIVTSASSQLPQFSCTFRTC